MRALFSPTGVRWLAAMSLLLAAFVTGCSTVAEIGTAVGQASGMMTPEQAESIKRSAAAVEKTFQDITPEQEYYIGRSVAATVLKAYKVYDNREAIEYINVLGQTLALASDMPETFGGYHFAILDSDEINAFAAPGGLIMISKGMIRCCTTEDALAAVLAHEVGHVENQHGLKAIRKGRLTSALTILALEGAKQLGGENLAEVTKAFEGSISDITSTLMNSGYSRKTEFEADRSAVIVMGRVGYNPEALVSMLHEMKKNLKPGGLDFAKTHPDPDVRIAELRKQLGEESRVQVVPSRQRRFEQAVGGI
ncbi:MAG: TPR repeat-containing protein YfgC precursor [Verrucomicrobia bacterium ADurb.Bin345]|nr:MAG: TPR repeat-containing protein YfgC precursor [Verrucomicrobia bacterium ADurb.Bin345]